MVHSGDLAVTHPDGYIELRDRAKDIVISGGENISTIEVERAVASHPAVLEVAVVAVRDNHRGERPKAVVVLKPGASTTAEEIIQHVKAKIARYKASDTVEFVDAPPQDLHRQDPKVRALREGMGRSRGPGPLT